MTKLRDKIPRLVLEPEEFSSVLLAAFAVFGIFFLVGSLFFRLAEVLRG